MHQVRIHGRFDPGPSRPFRQAEGNQDSLSGDRGIGRFPGDEPSSQDQQHQDQSQHPVGKPRIEQSLERDGARTLFDITDGAVHERTGFSRIILLGGQGKFDSTGQSTFHRGIPGLDPQRHLNQ